ncbi:unnamed protein product [Prunus brigantina]
MRPVGEFAQALRRLIYFAQARQSLSRPFGDLFCPGPSEFVQALRRFILPRPVGEFAQALRRLIYFAQALRRFILPRPSKFVQALRRFILPRPIGEFAQTLRRLIYFAQARRSLSRPFGCLLNTMPLEGRDNVSMCFYRSYDC